MSYNYILEIQQSLNVLGGGAATGAMWDAQYAANKYAGTTNLDLLAALNSKNGTTHLDFNAVCNALAGTTLLDGQAALSKLAGGTY